MGLFSDFSPFCGLTSTIVHYEKRRFQERTFSLWKESLDSPYEGGRKLDTLELTEKRLPNNRSIYVCPSLQIILCAAYRITKNIGNTYIMNVLICDILIRVSSVELSGVFSAVFKNATLNMTLYSTIFNTNICWKKNCLKDIINVKIRAASCKKSIRKYNSIRKNKSTRKHILYLKMCFLILLTYCFLLSFFFLLTFT